MGLADLINLERVEILEQDEGSYRVKYSEEEYEVVKSDDTFFVNGGSGVGMAMTQEMRQVQRLCLGEIFQDEEAPEEYLEVMMFHEIREMEYREADLEDAHERAVNDELLYVMKFLGEEALEGYLKFAEDYREDNPREGKKRFEGIRDSFEEWARTYNCSHWDLGYDKTYEVAEKIVGMTQKITEEKLSEFLSNPDKIEQILSDCLSLPLDVAKTWGLPILFLCAAANAIPKEKGPIYFSVPSNVVVGETGKQETYIKDAKFIISRYLKRPNTEMKIS